MLKELEIKNYALIEHLHLEPHQALNIITGETGAGKSIMLGAIGLLLGNRADSKSLFNENEKCVIEALFDIGAYQMQQLFENADLDYQIQTTIRREITPAGKSRAFINDTPVNLETLKIIGTKLLDVHSQHDNLQLGNHIFQLNIIDLFADNKNLLKDYQIAYKSYSQIKKQYHQKQKEYTEFQKEYDYNLFLFKELEDANLQPDEQEEAEIELKKLERSEEIKTKFQRISMFLSLGDNAITDELRVNTNLMSSLADVSGVYAQLYERLESCRTELQDIANEIEKEYESIEYSPEKIEELNSRLSLIYQLQKKHQVKTIEFLLKKQEELEEKVKKVENFDEEIQDLAIKLKQVKEILDQKAQVLSDSRYAIKDVLAKELMELLADLGMPNAILKVNITPQEPSNEGIDVINFLFSANKGVNPQEISKVASGGEFSRLMLAVKYILANKTALPTIIFDEIDTGISGEIAFKMGKMLQIMSNQHQIMAITHLPQIASKGNSHYFVYKDNNAERTISRIKQLSEQERIHEIAQMISGSTISENAIRSAKELLEMV
ncbi:MAG: DNA repair protein RecN [Bacteroidetes bacterium]|nr:MAG: DNA repair protein RecN [Bacteroidota bacterium]